VDCLDGNVETLHPLTVLPRVPAVKRLFLSGLPQLRTIPDRLFTDCGTYLTEIHLADLTGVTALGCKAVYGGTDGSSNGDAMEETSGCRLLRKFLLTRLPHLEQIGRDFLFDVSALAEVTIQDLPMLMDVGANWLASCNALGSVHLVDFPKLSHVESGLLEACSESLTEVTLAGLPTRFMIGGSGVADDSKASLFATYRASKPLERNSSASVLHSRRPRLKASLNCTVSPSTGWLGVPP
jgi:hypothetical protein